MEILEALDTIGRGRRLIEEWVDQKAVPHRWDGRLINDRDVTRCLRTMVEASRHAPLHEALAVAKIVKLAEVRLNLARCLRPPPGHDPRTALRPIRQSRRPVDAEQSAC